MFGWGTRTRTQNDGTKNRCVTITLFPNKNGAADEAYDPRDLHIISVMFLRRTELQQHNFDSIH